MEYNIDFNAASAAWRKNKKISSFGYSIYLCKEPNCSKGRMIYKKHHLEYNNNISSDYCYIHQKN
jgi:hypothetical protein